MAGKTKRVNHGLVRQRGAELVRLVASGMTLHEASQKLEVPWQRARLAFERALSEVASERTRQQVLHTELHTLNLLQQALMPEALLGDTAATLTVLRIMDRRSKYLGLDEEIKVRIQITEVNKAVEQISHIVEGEAAEVVELRRVGA